MEWKRGPILGRGSTATVSLATTSTGELFAVKSTHLSSSTLLQKEQNLISQFSSPYIIKCLGSDITENSMYNLFLEYVPGGTLSDLVKNNSGSLKQSVIQFYTHQLLLGLDYLHSKGIVHCDIKGQNLLISEDGLKIADFGCAKYLEEKMAIAGSPAYMSPEVARGEEQSFPADVWAVGCTIIEMSTGSNPWPEVKDPASALFIIGYSDGVPDIPSWFSDDAQDFLSKCLIKDPTQRWTVAKLLQHPFMSSVGEIDELMKKSPTSVMDQGFWDALEVSNSSGDLMEIDSFSVSAMGRIRGLIGGGVDLNLMFSGWIEEDEDWVTVRSNGVEGNLEIFEQRNDVYEELIEADSFMFSSSDEDEEIGTHIAIQDLLNCYSDETSVIDEQRIVFDYENEDDNIFVLLLRIILIKLLITPDQLLLQFLLLINLVFDVTSSHFLLHYGKSCSEKRTCIALVGVIN